MALVRRSPQADASRATSERGEPYAFVFFANRRKSAFGLSRASRLARSFAAALDMPAASYSLGQLLYPF